MKLKEELLTAEYLRRILRYDPETGKWWWLERKKGRQYKYPAGRRSNGRWIITIDYETYYGYRLAWLYMTGELAPDTIDHIDRNKANNEWRNLRLAAYLEQNYNKEGYPSIPYKGST